MQLPLAIDAWLSVIWARLWGQLAPHEPTRAELQVALQLATEEALEAEISARRAWTTVTALKAQLAQLAPRTSSKEV